MGDICGGVGDVGGAVGDWCGEVAAEEVGWVGRDATVLGLAPCGHRDVVVGHGEVDEGSELEREHVAGR